MQNLMNNRMLISLMCLLSLYTMHFCDTKMDTPTFLVHVVEMKEIYLKCITLMQPTYLCMSTLFLSSYL